MTTTDEQLARWGREAILDTISDLAHDRMGLAEQLEDDLDGLTEPEQDALIDRYEQAIRNRLPADA